MDFIHITDVAPRDGLQNQAVAVSTQAKLQLVGLLAEAGVASVEVTSFVSPRAVPQMADAADLLPQVTRDFPGLRASVLVPNLKGLERARAALLNVLAASLDEDQRRRAIVVFDAKSGPPDSPGTVMHGGLTVRFAQGHAEADELIEQLIAADSAPRRLIVVSSDRRIQQDFHLQPPSSG